jgi:hypothetical protein
LIPAAGLQTIDVRRYRDAASAIAAACQEMQRAIRVLADCADDHFGVDPEAAHFGDAGSAIAIANAVIESAQTAQSWIEGSTR